MIYLIQVGNSGPVKIGHTLGPIENRLAMFQTAHHEKVRLICSVSGGIDREKEIHKKFDYFRIRGEWFKEDVIKYKSYLMFGDMKCFICNTNPVDSRIKIKIPSVGYKMNICLCSQCAILPKDEIASQWEVLIKD